MRKATPRLLIAGSGSGCGKTTVTCALLQALAESGRRPGAAKCGPDYIDPMFHRAITGAAGCNLDPFFFDDDTLRFLLAQAGAGKDVTLIEGVMGYYDGIGLASSRASTFEVAQRTESPVVLVLNAKGAGLSVLAVLEGFLRFVPRSGICGVVLNGCTAMSYPMLKREIESRFDIRACGFLPQLVCCRICEKYDGPAFYLDPQEGILLCEDCAKKAGKTCNLDMGALYALRHICLVEDKKIFAFKISVGSLAKLSAVAERYALTHLDKPLKSYDFLKSVLP